MGATQSLPSEVEGVCFATTQPPRNKLTKPRTNSNATREASCFPSLPPSLSRLSLSGNSRSSPALQHQVVGDDSHGGILAIEYLNTISPNEVRQCGAWASAGHSSGFPAYLDPSSPDTMVGVDPATPGVVGAMPVSTGMRRRGSMATRSSTNCSAACAPPLNLNSEAPSIGTVRRRSQLLAAPPATATRKPVKSHNQSQSLPITLVSLDPCTLSPPVVNDAGRCTTPSGYSVLGAFKRGSLRIANGAASPAPSSSRASPELSMKTGYFSSSLELPEVLNNRLASKAEPLVVVTDSVLPAHEVRLVPPSPTDSRDGGEDRILESLFSFTRSSSIYNADINGSSFGLDLATNGTLESLRLPIYGPKDSCETLSSTTSSNISIGYEYHRILTEQCLNQDSDITARVDSKTPEMPVSRPCTKADEYHKTLFREAQKENEKRLRRPGIAYAGGGGTDSGYSSSGSINSWKTAWSEQHTEPNPITHKLEDPSFISKDTLIPPPAGERVVCMVAEPMPRRRSVIAAIRRRYSQGDLKAFARSSGGIKQPSIPAVPAPERRKSLWKPLPELKRRRSMVTASKGPVPQIELTETSSTIQLVPPLPHRDKLGRKGSFNLLTIEDYLPLVGGFPLTPAIDHTIDAANYSFTTTSNNTQGSIVEIGVGRALNRGSRITGQDYYQRFSKRQQDDYGVCH